ncbi:ArgR family transcriptional regulator [Alkalibaculum bacchi]|uniref:Arginine repressor n=1 Tax=Alkalibaculum bacchi TaxID=645887 RepID=A0A366I496_9FIRM|nr:arginine repressor [Alkalibaculum bacchi]RBP61796.1 ArgR family transcriptional regulator [Alkalibaculum bacchi]
MKISRQSKLLEIIENDPIETQEELARRLKESGFNVTQATISRDIKELKIIKVLNEEGKYHYAPFRDTNSEGNEVNERIVNVFREAVISIDYSGNMIVLKTLSGTAMGATAAIDAMALPDVVGCIAGDDTIFALARSEDKVANLVTRFRKMMR